MAPKDTIWSLEAHTAAKHEILRRYLGAWFPILATYNKQILYVDGFCGPGRYMEGEPGSPILAIQEAVQHGKRLDKNQLYFFFVDERQDRIDHLQSEVDEMKLPSNFHCKLSKSTFDQEMTRILDKRDKRHAKNEPPIPTFAFVDPFGFEGLPFAIIQRMLSNPKTEVFINFMADFVNRFLTHPVENVRNRIVELFGTQDALNIAQNSANRIEELRHLYQAQLKTSARFVRYFEMKDGNNRTIYYLFFASNSTLGHEKMKEAFWSVDGTNGFSFSDATVAGAEQMLLFDINDTPRQLGNCLVAQFRGKTMTVGEIERFVIDETSFLGKHMRGALDLLEKENGIAVHTVKTDGTRRRGKYFPNEVIVTFR